MFIDRFKILVSLRLKVTPANASQRPHKNISLITPIFTKQYIGMGSYRLKEKAIVDINILTIVNYYLQFPPIIQMGQLRN